MNLNELKEQVKNLSTNIRNMKKYFLDKDINKIEIMENKYYLKFNWLFTDNYILSLHIDNISLHIDHKGYLLQGIINLLFCSLSSFVCFFILLLYMINN